MSKQITVEEYIEKTKEELDYFLTYSLNFPLRMMEFEWDDGFESFRDDIRRDLEKRKMENEKISSS